MCEFFDKRGYPASAVKAGHHRAKQIDRQSALQTSQKENNNSSMSKIREMQPQSKLGGDVRQYLENEKLCKPDITSSGFCPRVPVHKSRYKGPNNTQQLTNDS